MSISTATRASSTQAKYETRFDGFILHCPLPQRVPDNPFHTQWLGATDRFFGDPSVDRAFTDPENLTILTYNTRPEISLLERCVDRLGLEDLVVLGRGRAGWSWWYKIELVLDFLARGLCTTEHVICLDADDVLIVDDPVRILPAFLAADCDLLFCGTRGDQPPSARCWDFENGAYPSGDPLHRHLNAGCYVGHQDVLRECLEEIATGYRERAEWCHHEGEFDDQLAWRHLHARHFPRLRVDVGCDLFLRFDEDR